MKILIALTLALMTSLTAQAMTCIDYQINMRTNGIAVDVKLRAVGLFDQTQVVEKQLNMRLFPVVPDVPCNIWEEFTLGGEIVARTAGGSYPVAGEDRGVFRAAGDFSPTFRRATEWSYRVQAHRDVLGAMLSELGLSAFEGLSHEDPFQTLVDLFGSLPTTASTDIRLGTVEIQGVLYQLSVTQTSVHLL